MKTVAETSQSREYRRVYKDEDSRRDKTEQCLQKAKKAIMYKKRMCEFNSFSAGNQPADSLIYKQLDRQSTVNPLPLSPHLPKSKHS